MVELTLMVTHILKNSARLTEEKALPFSLKPGWGLNPLPSKESVPSPQSLFQYIKQ
jgi:hypothetical protein